MPICVANDLLLSTHRVDRDRTAIALNIRDPEVDELATRLAKAKGVTKTQDVKEALLSELERQEPQSPLWERLQPIIDRNAARPNTGVVIDKAFFDDLSDEDER